MPDENPPLYTQDRIDPFAGEKLGWGDLEAFFHVAASGGLSAASRHTGLSAPTLGRRMVALEQRAGQALFQRGPRGYSLTPAGQALFARVRAMNAAAQPVNELLAPEASRPLIRLSAGTSTARFLGDNHHALCRPDDGFRLHYTTTEVTLDVSHRELDLGIRNSRPESGAVATRRLGQVAFAPYRSWSAPASGMSGWVALDLANARHPAARWLHGQDLPIVAMASSVAMVHDLVRAGVGIGLMPCMIGDRDDRLCRAGPVLADLTEDQFLVVHDDDRHRPPLRRLIERLVKLYADQAALLAGERPLR